MARPAAAPSARLKVLARAKERAAKCKRGETLTAVPMAEMLEVSWVTLRDWCNSAEGFAESGAFEGGSNGIEYKFKPKPTVAWLIRYFEKERDHRAEKARRARKMVGAGDLVGVPDDYSLDDLRKSIQLRSQLIEQKVREGKLTDAERGRQVFREVFSEMQQAGMRAAQKQDPTGQWPVELRESFDDAISSVMHAMEVAARRVLTDNRGDFA